MTSQVPRGHHSSTTAAQLTATPASIAVARSQVVGFCRRHGFAALEDTAALLTSELVTNAVQHGIGPLTLSITRVPGELRVDVSDNSTDPPRLQATLADQPNGRGLLLVDTLATSWRYRPQPGGKTVSFTLTTSVGDSPVVLHEADNATR